MIHWTMERSIVRRMMRLPMIGLIALYTIGCASWIHGRSPQSSLHESGVLLLSKEDDVVEVDSDYELSAKWLVAGRLDSTRALVNENSRPVTASFVEANKLWMLLKSPSWQERKDLPAEYFNSPDLYITLRGGKNKETKHVVVGIPIAQIQEITLYREDIDAREAEVEESRTLAESIVTGAVGGSGIGLAAWVASINESDDHPGPGEAIGTFLFITSMGAVGGAVGLPVYDTCKAWSKAWRAKRTRNTKVWWGWEQPLSIGEDDYTISIKR